MNGEVTCVFLRLSSGARHSSLNNLALDRMTGAQDPVILSRDGRDNSVYWFPLPDQADETRIISALVTEKFIDEAWTHPVPAGRVNGQSSKKDQPGPS